MALPRSGAVMLRSRLLLATHGRQQRSYGSTAQADYCVEMPTSTVRFGLGVTREVGMDFVNQGATNVCLVTDPTVAHLEPVKVAVESLHKHGVQHQVFSDVGVEPTDTSIDRAVAFCRQHQFDAFLAVGGGSAIDTCKLANLLTAYPEADLLDFTNAPVGKGLPVERNLSPLVAVPTTSGTGSETTGTAVYDHTGKGLKTGIAHKKLRPSLGLIDPLHCLSMPRNVTVYSGFDVLAHALESFTAIPYTKRIPRPANPNLRPPYQGSNPISDVWCLEGITLMSRFLKRAVNDPEDVEARTQMHLASTMAGIGFGTGGVHLPHALSYGLAGCVRDFYADDYPAHKPCVPHGLSVVLTAPAVFEFTGQTDPDRHLKAAGLLGADVTLAKSTDAGRILADAFRRYLSDLDVEDGLSGINYSVDDIPALVAATMPQQRLLNMAPLPVTEKNLTDILYNSMTNYS